MTVRILTSAFRDLASACEFYENQSPGLGLRFFLSVDSDIDRLEKTGGVHAQTFGFHRCLAKKFPFAIYYKIINQEVLVFRILDCRRDPADLAGSLGESG
jgi:hypothetical protein